MSNLAAVIAAARGDEPVDLLLTDARVVNLFTGSIDQTQVAVFQGRVVGFGDYQAKATLSLQGAYLTPGLIDGHMHIESSMVTPDQFALAVVPKGTTAIVADPHEIANVRGLEGIRYMLEAAQDSPLDVFVMVPSCVPATHMETAGASLSAQDLASLKDPRILGLGEMMDFPGVVAGRPEVLAKLEAIAGRLDGHAPKLSGKQLYAYVAAGIESDHECTTPSEASEKLALGMYLLLREGSVTRDLGPLLPVVNPRTLRRCMFCTDDREPADLIDEGHIDFLVRKAVSLGCQPIDALTMASLNAAEYFRLKGRGAIAPGYLADLVVTRSLEDFRAEMVFKRGRLVAREGQPLWQASGHPGTTVRNTVNFAALDESSLRITDEGDRARVIGLIPNQIVTSHLVEEVTRKDGEIVADPERDQLKLAVVERHHASGQIGLGLARGFGLKHGALASTVGHDSHNLVLLGTNDADMRAAAEAVREMQGGWVVVAGGEVKARLPLPIGGLMSDHPLAEVRQANQDLLAATRELGGTASHPFMSLSFLALPVIPSLKLTDQGLVDVDRFEVVGLTV
ncbi:MAG: adenine deaminase [Vulcanimicrobiota bacterium]